MDDGGRWSFETTGTPDPVEDSFPYSARRKKDRFTSSTLGVLLRAYGFPRLDAEEFLSAREYSLFQESHTNQDWARSIQGRACTLEQRDDPAHGYYERGLGWVAHIETHAASVVADFERAVRLNPSYEPLVRSHLALARKKLAAQG